MSSVLFSRFAVRARIAACRRADAGWAGRSARPAGACAGARPWPQNGSASPGQTASSARRNAASIEASAAGVVGLEAQHHHRRGVRGRARPKPWANSTRRPSRRDHLARFGEARGRGKARPRAAGTSSKGSPSCIFRFSSGCSSRRAAPSARRWRRRGRRGSRAGGRPRKAVVEAVPALLEEHVAAHLAGERAPVSRSFALSSAWPGLPHRRPPPCARIHGARLRVHLTS